MESVALGPFVLEQRIGRGGMGEVWRARHRSQHVRVAVKVLTAEGSSRPMFVDSFKNEVRAVAALDHPHIAMVLDHGEVPPEAALAANRAGIELVTGTPYLAMELVEGGDTLAEHMGRLPWYEIERILRGLLDALAHAHARGMVHRDLKLSNVLYDPKTHVYKLTDFGIAHGLLATGDPFRWGTPAYMPPEQLLGRWWDYGPWTDLYSLGCCAWALLCGSRPFPDDMARTSAQRRLPPVVSTVTVPPALESWLHQLTDPEPAARYQRAADAAWALHALSRGFVSQEAVALVAAGRVLPKDHTITLSFEGGHGAEEETLVPQKPSPTRLPPIPKGWRRRRAPRRASWLVGAGLGLYGVRRIPMIARVPERDLLWAALREVREDGVARAVVVTGAAGCGKTRLADWLAERAHEVGAATVMRATHSAGGGPQDGVGGMLATSLRTGGLSAGQVRQRVAAAMRASSNDVADLWEVRGLMDVATPGIEGTPPAFGSPAERHALVRRFVERQAARRPVLLVLDDVHGLGTHHGLDTLEFASSLLRNAPVGCPLLVLAIARDDGLAQAPAERAALEDLGRTPGARRIALGPLPEADHRALVEELLGLEGALARLVEERTAGNPMFAVQLVGDWVQRGILVPGARGFELRPGAEVAVPDSVYAAWVDRIGAFLQHRSDADRHALELAALLGQRVDRAEWRAACVARGIRPANDLVDALLAVRLAVPDEGGGQGSWSFAHGMLRESLERSAEEAFRAPALHRACAAVLAGSRGDRERLARHLLGASAFEGAIEPLVDAIEARCRAGEYDRADGLLELWGWATREAKLAPPDPRWIGGLRAACSVHRYKDRPDEVRRLCARLEAGVRDFGWPRELVSYVRMQEGRLARVAGELDRAVSLFRDGLRQVRDPATKASFHARIGQVLVALGRLREADAEFRACLVFANTAGDDLGVGDAWLGLAALSIGRGSLDDAVGAADQARQAYRAARHRFGLASAEDMFGEVARHAGRLDDAIGHYRAAAELWRTLGTEGAGLYTQVNLLLVDLARGRRLELAADLERAAVSASAFADRGLLALVRIAQLAIDAAGDDAVAWDRHLAEGASLLAETQVASADLARTSELAAAEARHRGWGSRADELRDLAWAQWSILGRPLDAARAAGS